MPGDTKTRVIAALAAPAAVAFAWYLAAHKPGETGLLPPCLFHLTTGLHCPGCGGTRAAYLALHGDLSGALRQNAFFIALMPLVAVYLFALTRYAATGTWAPPKITGRNLTVVITVFVIGFAILRNLPGLEFLAPTPLP